MTMNNPGSPYVFVIPVNFGVRDPEGAMLPGKLEYFGPQDVVREFRTDYKQDLEDFLKDSPLGLSIWQRIRCRI